MENNKNIVLESLNIQKIIEDSQLPPLNKIKVLVNNGVDARRDLVYLLGVNNSILIKSNLRPYFNGLIAKQYIPLSLSEDYITHFMELYLSLFFNGTIKHLMFLETKIEDLLQLLKSIVPQLESEITITKTKNCLELYNIVYKYSHDYIITECNDKEFVEGKDYWYLVKGFLTKTKVGYGTGIKNNEAPDFFTFNKGMILTTNINERLLRELLGSNIYIFKSDLKYYLNKDLRLYINKKLEDLSVRQLDILYVGLVREDYFNPLLLEIDNILKKKLNIK